MAQVLDRQVIVRDFVKAGATSAAAAIAYAPREARVFRQLRAFGAIVDAGDDAEGARFYLDADRLAAFRRTTRRRTAAAAATGMLASMAAVLQVLEL